MSSLVVNLTKILVAQEIEDILETYPTDSYQQAFLSIDLRQALTTYVLSYISSCCITADECQCSSKNFAILNTLQQGKAHRELLIRQGIEELFQNHQISQSTFNTAEIGSTVTETPN